MTDEEITKMANDTINPYDSQTGQVIHIAAFQTGARWAKEHYEVDMAKLRLSLKAMTTLAESLDKRLAAYDERN